MKQKLICVAMVIASSLLAHQSWAQGTDVGITGVGLVSIQPIDDAYVGSPYLSEGIGGLAPGFGGGINIVAPFGLVVAAELSTARFEQEQSGRLVGGGFPNESIPFTTRLHDSLLTGLVGYSQTKGDTRLQVLGGMSVRLDDPTVGGEPRPGDESSDFTSSPWILTGGVDVLHSLSSRASLVFGGRYSFIDRKETHRYLGIGPHVLRISAGVRVRLN